MTRPNEIKLSHRWRRRALLSLDPFITQLSNFSVPRPVVGSNDWLGNVRSFRFSMHELPQVRQQIFRALLRPIVWTCLQMVN